jgi:hypothetical protein
VLGAGDATLAIEATPITPRAAVLTATDSKTGSTKPPLNRLASAERLSNFLFDFKLTSSTPLQLDAKDIAVSYGTWRGTTLMP